MDLHFDWHGVFLSASVLLSNDGGSRCNLSQVSWFEFMCAFFLVQGVKFFCFLFSDRMGSNRNMKKSKVQNVASLQEGKAREMGPDPA